MAKLLRIPHIYQDNDRLCLWVSFRMVLAFFKDVTSEDQLKNDLRDYFQDLGESEINHSEGIAIYAARNDYETTYYVHDLGVLNEDLYGANYKNRDKFTKALKAVPKDDRYNYQRTKLKLFIECIDAGVKLETAIPDISVITKTIDEGFPVIVSARANALHPQLQRPTTWSNHSVVAVGYDDRSIWVNDPGAKIEKLKDPYPVPVRDFLMGWYMVSARTFIIKPKG